MFVPVAEYTPDQPDFLNPGSGTVRNCLPRTAQSYGPMPSLAPYSSALAARCQGGYAFQDGGGNVNVFVGDAATLYRLTAGSTAWTDVSKAGGYTTAPDQRWSSVLFGSHVVMTNYTDPIQSFVLGSSAAFADLAAAAPKARHLAVVRDWLVAGNTVDGAFGPQPQRVWWSAIDDPTNWPTPGTSGAAAVQSDYQDLVGDAGWVQGIVGNLGTADGAVFQERAIVRMSYVGPPAIFSFATAEGARGTPAPGSIAQLGAVVYYLGEDGFYAFDGSSSRPIGANKIDRTFFADLDPSYFHRISAAVDPASKVCFWAYPGIGNNGGNPNRLLAYHWALDRFTLSDVTARCCCARSPSATLWTASTRQASRSTRCPSRSTAAPGPAAALSSPPSTPRTGSATSPARRWRRPSTPARSSSSRGGTPWSPTSAQSSTPALRPSRSVCASGRRTPSPSAAPSPPTRSGTRRSARRAGTTARG
jgi:hypothetical protein